MDDLTVLELELYKALLRVSDDDDFIIGAMTNVDNDEDKKTLIDFIKADKNVTYSSVLLQSVILDQKRRGIIEP